MRVVTNGLSTLELTGTAAGAPPEAGEEIIAADPVFGDVLGGDDGLFADIDIVDGGSNQPPEDLYFDNVVGTLMDILIEDEFEHKQNTFCKEHCHHFEDTEENKLVYMDIYSMYTELIESYLDRRLQEEIADFEMDKFYDLLSTREDRLVGEVFEMLLSLSDFSTFKELMLSYKKEKEEGNLFGISVRPMMLHVEEEEDGEHRPDLDDQLIVSPVSTKST
eukprot:CAMPEP_0117651750 /NCGR_PEP_ID=MMETSP0804-20121206/2260_1 /TAXON_ID=1074897 /ORGANISM="Tetraselmis astigmatica, Strain CCMP880" /LENGTH=219 /DNA_ID=CAMNT_0005457751 /DNA_START=133 /DNA_END=792 /DNA_ORIENTATION=+